MTALTTTHRILASATATVVGLGILTACGGAPSDAPTENRQAAEQNENPGAGKERFAPPRSEQLEPEEYAFVEQYVDAMSAAMKSGDGTQLRELGTDDCNACTTMADFQEDLHGKGGEYLGDPSYQDLELIEGPEGGDDKLTWIRVAMTQPKVEQRPERGAATIPVGGAEEFNDFGLTREEGEWKVAMFCGVTESQPALGCLGQ